MAAVCEQCADTGMYVLAAKKSVSHDFGEETGDSTASGRNQAGLLRMIVGKVVGSERSN